MNAEMKRLDDDQMSMLLSMAGRQDYQVCVWGAGNLGTGIGRRILSDHGIKVDFYCDNNEALTDTQIIDGIYCRSISHLVENTEKTICFILVGYTVVKSVYMQLKGLGIRNIVTYEDLLGYSVTLRQYFPFMKQKDTALYTCITGDYDDVREPEFISERCDYYLLSEKRPEGETAYQWININDVVPADITDNIFKNRYCKINVHKIFQQYRYSVYVDGNITVTGDIAESISNLRRTRIAVTTAYDKDTVYSHALRCMVQGTDYPERWQKQMKSYWMQGLPKDTAVYLCNILVREHNNPVCIRLMSEWWSEFCTYVRRDQTSFPYILWKNGFGQGDILELSKLFQVDPLVRNRYWEYKPQHRGEKFHI